MNIYKLSKPEKTFYYTGNQEVVAIVRRMDGAQFWKAFMYDGRTDSEHATREGAEAAVESGNTVAYQASSAL